ncbi:transcriptional regulator of RNA polII, SAGA, subunit [Histomonas meleagridis]|uniref:transcriptional regulator of RNA polII, SAGA, subunit n=1 Tax=Histomonas meleagridis TaxID=135588 RepID=UPI00355A0168|nr:transcriptional regulator of RNA polII, SAGA, subunit [Histomonas meleagridis]KAH0801064.1 transcriptional regulator of RNA polII, SAGA, subunit [Histomonas meleagridis]
MSANVDEGIQVGRTTDVLLAKARHYTNVYSTRKDCQTIKEQILEIVEDKDKYWNTLASFLHGQCSKQEYDDVMNQCLTDYRAKLLHNDLIRSILFNAHFSMIPPPGVNIVKTPTPPQPRPIQAPSQNSRNSSFSTYSASDMRHLPSINQLSSRIGILLSSRNIKVESKATGILFQELKRFIMSILENSALLVSSKGINPQENIVITHAQIMHVLNSDYRILNVVSPSLLSKYSSFLQ